jgi:hypothetical protein
VAERQGEETQYLYRYISFCQTKRHDNSCNTITFTDILLYFLLQQQFLDNIIKAGVKVNIFVMYQKNLLFLVFELKVVVFLYVSHRDPKKIPGQTPFNVYSLHVQPNTPFSIHIDHATWFI